MDQERPGNNIRIEWRYGDRSPMTFNSIAYGKLSAHNERTLDVTIGCSTTVFDFTFKSDRYWTILEGRTQVPCGLGEVALIMLDLHITGNDNFSLTTWNNRKRLYRHFVWNPENGYIHQWELDKSKWVRSCPRSDRHGEKSAWLAAMAMLATQGKRMGGMWRRVCEYGADAVNEDPFWRIQLQ